MNIVKTKKNKVWFQVLGIQILISLCIIWGWIENYVVSFDQILSGSIFYTIPLALTIFSMRKISGNILYYWLTLPILVLGSFHLIFFPFGIFVVQDSVIGDGVLYPLIACVFFCMYQGIICFLTFLIKNKYFGNKINEKTYFKFFATVLVQLMIIINLAIYWMIDMSSFIRYADYYFWTVFLFGSFVVIVIVVWKWVNNIIYWITTLIPLMCSIFYLILFPFEILKFGNAPFATTAAILPLIFAIVFTIVEVIICLFVFLIKKWIRWKQGK